MLVQNETISGPSNEQMENSESHATVSLDFTESTADHILPYSLRACQRSFRALHLNLRAFQPACAVACFVRRFGLTF